jgi:membrane peptidoglycan carboxypeptidase
VSNRWSRAQLLDALAERGEFTIGFRGVEQASRGLFNKPAAEVNVAEAAVLGALLSQGHLDPWCGPGRTAELRRKILEKMRDNGAIDDAAFEAANAAPLGLADPPPNRKPCE